MVTQTQATLKLYLPRKHLREMLKGKAVYYYNVNGQRIKVGEADQMHQFDALDEMKQSV